MYWLQFTSGGGYIYIHSVVCSGVYSVKCTQSTGCIISEVLNHNLYSWPLPIFSPPPVNPYCSIATYLSSYSNNSQLSYTLRSDTAPSFLNLPSYWKSLFLLLHTHFVFELNLIKGSWGQFWPQRSKTRYYFLIGSLWKGNSVLEHLMISKHLQGSKMTPGPMLGQNWPQEPFYVIIFRNP